MADSYRYQKNGVPVTDGQQQVAPVADGQVPTGCQNNNAREVQHQNQSQARPRAGAISGPSCEDRPQQTTSETAEELERRACEHLRQLRELEANYDAPQRREELRILTEDYVRRMGVVRNHANTANVAVRPELREVRWNGRETNPN